AAPKRKTIFLRRGFQLRYASLVAGSLVVLLVFASLHGLFAAKTVLSSNVPPELWGALESSTLRLLFVGLLYIAVVTVAAVFLAHRYTGPAARLEHDIRSMVDGRHPLESLKIRDGDELEGVVKAINELIQKMSDSRINK